MFRKLLNKIGYWLIRDEISEPERPSYLLRPWTSLANNQKKTVQFTDLTHINGMNFIIYSAIGGKVIHFNSYDSVRDKTESRLYIITDGANFGEEIGQIITRESLSY